MCGLYGFSLHSNRVSIDRVTRLTTALAVTNQERGSMSWGASAGHGRRVAGLGGASKGIGKIIPHALQTMDTGLIQLLGHTRLATQGKVSVENSHPFVGKHFTLAHNGQVYGVNHRVDSMALLEKLEGGESFEGLRGYGIAIWWEKDNRGVATIARLSAGGDIAISSGPWGCAWSSDRDHLDIALQAAGLTGRKNHKWLVDTGEAVEIQGSDVYKAARYAGERRWQLESVYGSDDQAWRRGMTGTYTVNGKTYSWDETFGDDGKTLTVSSGEVKKPEQTTPTTPTVLTVVPTDPIPDPKPTPHYDAPGRKRVTPFMLKTVAEAYNMTEGDLVGMPDDDIRDAFFEVSADLISK